jgi:glycerol dehydrogenase-like iron-containing ADH family enzyme
MSQQKYKPFVVRLGTTDKFADIQVPQDEEDEQDSDAAEHYRKYFKIKKDMERMTPKEFQKKYIWGGTRNPTGQTRESFSSH